MVMSRDPGFRFRKSLFFAKFYIKLWESYQSWWKLASEQKRYRQKTNWGWKTPPTREEVRAAGRTTGKKAFAVGRTTGKKAFAASRTTGKKAFAALQARRFLPHLRQEGFCRTSGEMVLLPHNEQTIYPCRSR